LSVILQISDFENGRFAIPTDPRSKVDLQVYIDRHEKGYLLRLFGQEFYDLFIADLNSGTPSTTRFEDVFNPFFDSTRCCDDCLESEGIKVMLQGIIYFYWARDQYTRLTNAGVKRTKSQNSKDHDAQAHDVYTRYNNAGETFEAIRKKMKCSELYPEYAGCEFDFVMPF